MTSASLLGGRPPSRTGACPPSVARLSTVAAAACTNDCAYKESAGPGPAYSAASRSSSSFRSGSVTWNRGTISSEPAAPLSAAIFSSHTGSMPSSNSSTSSCQRGREAHPAGLTSASPA
ncbi:hypothetical protein ACFWY6_25980 [Streptomyces sp. NPDC059037]|uniref:hypothetical protein n=1 Tax=Streptomyces sp. NPDC059037 TaxID=3346710 RepID=UPI003676FF43